ncbi:MAG: DoxX family protein [Elusimicrobia bacterium]|nr:DoxX family protein [Elusimicrobiota bacterium]
MNLTLLTGRVLYCAIFVFSGLKHFSPQTIDYAAGHGVPMPQLLVPLSGLLALAGGLMLMFGWRARAGAWLLLLFLLPVTFTMHDFWNVADPIQAMQQQGHFFKNLSLIGGATAWAFFGAGPYSLDSRRVRRLFDRRPLVERRRQPVLH